MPDQGKALITVIGEVVMADLTKLQPTPAALGGMRTPEDVRDWAGFKLEAYKAFIKELSGEEE